MEKAPRVLLIGDACIDHYLTVEVKRVNPEAPQAPLYTVITDEQNYGMGLNVASCLQNLGMDVTSYHPDPSRIRKTRVIDNNTGNQLFRIDDDTLSCAVNIDNVDLSQFDCVVISDYNKGYISDKTIHDVSTRFKGPIFLDTKKPNIEDFNKCIIKINLAEAKAYSVYHGHTAVPMHDNLIVTLGDKGCAYSNTQYPAYKVPVSDPCGAGDAFLAGLVYGCFSTLDIYQAIRYAVVNAGISVSHVGTYAPYEEELLKNMEKYNDQTFGKS